MRAKRWLAAAIASFFLAMLVLHPRPELPFAVRIWFEDAPAQLRVPVAGVRPGQIGNSWHAPRQGGRLHEGIDIFAPRGRPVLSSTEGIVWRGGVNRLGGHVVWVLGPGRQLHYYAHLARPADVKPGQRVEPGSVLG